VDKEYTPAEAKAWLNGYDEGKKFAKREWVGLTEEETKALIQKWAGELVFEVTQALKEKNCG